MKAITLIQPWASLIMLGHKQIETRSWNTKYRGDLVIHAAKTMPCRMGETITVGDFTVERDRSGLLLRGPITCPITWPYRLPQGAILGHAQLVDTISTDSPECVPDGRNYTLGDFSPSRFAWYLESVQRYPTTTCKGALGIWNVPDEIAARLT